MVRACSASLTLPPLRRCVAFLQSALRPCCQCEFALRFRCRQHSDSARRQFECQRVCRASCLPLPSRTSVRSRRPISTARCTPQDGARLRFARAALLSRVHAGANLNERLTMRCSGRGCHARCFLPPPFPHHAAVAPAAPVAELGVVRRLRRSLRAVTPQIEIPPNARTLAPQHRSQGRP